MHSAAFASQPGILQIQHSAELFVERDKSYAAKFKETGKELLYPREFRNFEELCLAAEDISLTRDFARGGEATDQEFVLAAGEKRLSTRFEHRQELIFC